MKFNLSIKGLQVNQIVQAANGQAIVPVVALEELHVGQEFESTDIINIVNNNVGIVKSAVKYITDEGNIDNLMNIMDKMDAYEYASDIASLERTKARSVKEGELGIRFVDKQEAGNIEQERQAAEERIKQKRRPKAAQKEENASPKDFFRMLAGAAQEMQPDLTEQRQDARDMSNIIAILKGLSKEK